MPIGLGKEDCGTESSMKPVSEGGKGTGETMLHAQALLPEAVTAAGKEQQSHLGQIQRMRCEYQAPCPHLSMSAWHSRG